MNCIGLSKVGDTSIDIPEANVIIQVGNDDDCTLFVGGRAWFKEAAVHYIRRFGDVCAVAVARAVGCRLLVAFAATACCSFCCCCGAVVLLLHGWMSMVVPVAVDSSAVDSPAAAAGVAGCWSMGSSWGSSSFWSTYTRGVVAPPALLLFQPGKFQLERRPTCSPHKPTCCAWRADCSSCFPVPNGSLQQFLVGVDTRKGCTQCIFSCFCFLVFRFRATSAAGGKRLNGWGAFFDQRWDHD